MTQRSYNLYCPLTHALDLVGERWSLLIIRNLFTGPKRFSDLLRGLPGIGTSVLTTRLKTLEESGIIQSRFLPPPAASSVYELTDYGRGLKPAMDALFLWGGQSFKPSVADYVVTDESVVLMINAIFSAVFKSHGSGSYAVRVEDDAYSGSFKVGLQDGTVMIEKGVPAASSLTLVMNLETLEQLSVRQLSVQDATAQNKIQFIGTESDIGRFLTV